MNQQFVLGKLSDLMGWNSETARREFDWLLLMSRMKYDGYQEFLAGMRFIESLADWLQQFKPNDRKAAYDFVRGRLIFVGPAEMRHLVELFYPETVQPRLVQHVAEQLNIPPYQVWSEPKGVQAYQALLRKTLFIELSDGGRIDIFRRANARIISNEQIVTAPRIHKDKWDELLKDLRGVTNNGTDRFAFVFLVDDFTASGTTLIRDENGQWKGKLCKFWAEVKPDLTTLFEDGWKLCVHHYLATERALRNVTDRDIAIRTALGAAEWFAGIELTAGMRLDDSIALTPETEDNFVRIVNEYYDKSIENDHMRKGGTDARYGFGGCGLPLILEHNTPNNTIALLWSETEGLNSQHAMRPLFRRRQRHG